MNVELGAITSRIIKFFVRTTPNYEELIGVISRETAMAFNCFCSVSFLKIASNKLEVAGGYANDTPENTAKLLHYYQRTFQLKSTAVAESLRSLTGRVVSLSVTPDIVTSQVELEDKPPIEYQLGHIVCAVMKLYEDELVVLCLARYGQGCVPFTEHEVECVDEIADHATLALINARLFDDKKKELVEKEKSAIRLGLLTKLSLDLATAEKDFHSVLQVFASHLISALCDGCSVRLVQGLHGSLKIENHPFHKDPAKVQMMKQVIKQISELPPESLTGRVVASRQSILISSTATNVEYSFEPYKTLVRMFDIQSIMVVPVIVRGNVIAVVETTRNSGSPVYTQQDLEFLQDIVVQATPFIRNAGLLWQQEIELHERKKLSDKLRILSTTAHEFASVEGDFDRLWHGIVHRFSVLIGGTSYLRMLPQTEKVFTYGDSYYYNQNSAILKEFSDFVETFGSIVDGGLLDQSIKSQKPLFVPRVSHDSAEPNAPKHVQQVHLIAKTLDISSLMILPLVVQGQVIGFIAMAQHHGAQYTQEDFELFQDLGAAVILSVLNASLVRSLQAELKQREAAQVALKTIEDQLRHSQKMDAIGRLAGGIAHDFNNLLSVIIGYSQLLGEDPELPMHAHEAVDEVLKASNRAKSLTQQLLTFSRNTITAPQIIDINTVVLQSERMLSRLVGENIELKMITSKDLGKVKGEPTQLEQVLMNLVLNARDAMPSGGSILIETKNVIIEDSSTKVMVGINPGSYVMLSVSDTGVGMDAPTRERIFEPFFTTKEKGKGTGLGLSVVFGIVRQHGGRIWVYSEPKLGSTFKIYLPQCVDPKQSVEPSANVRTTIGGGNETIVLVEDDDQIRDMVKVVLQRKGYQVVAAENGERALALIEALNTPIHLLFTDVVMPKLSGTELAKQVRNKSPNTKVLFMSGYTENAFVDFEVDFQYEMLSKPVTPDAILQKIRSILDN